jgi:hypothetical protein
MVNNMKAIFVWLITLVFGGSGLAYAAGPYTSSAHGNSSSGVLRKSLSTPPDDYARGNCAHCHEQHASIGGVEPAPAGGSPSKFCVFAENFDISASQKPYDQRHNFCFYCHYGAGTYQADSFSNYTYSYTFGGNPDSTPDSIFDAFNDPTVCSSYHNLNDVYEFITGQGSHTKATFDNFPQYSNPCSGCHNVHIAKRNREYTGDPSYTAISKPSAHDELWGDSTGETLRYHTAKYQAPYSETEAEYEPDGSNSEPGDGWGSNMPDYVTFCTDCHNTSNNIYSTTLGRYLTRIDWTASGDKHGGGKAIDGDTIHERHGDGAGAGLKPPYDEASKIAGYNYVLSCTDCHEPHGAKGKSYLLRRYINGEAVAAETTTCESSTHDDDNWKAVCDRCHTISYPDSNCVAEGKCHGPHGHGATTDMVGAGPPVPSF